MGLESWGKNRPSATSLTRPGLAISVVCLGLALLLLAPVFNWAETTGTGGGLLSLAVWSVRTVFDTSGESGGWTRLLLVVLWGVAVTNCWRVFAGWRGAWHALMSEVSTPEGERRIWKLLLRHVYLVVVPVLALTCVGWQAPLLRYLEGRWAESYLQGRPVSWWNFGLTSIRWAPALLGVASLANLLAFVTMTRALSPLRGGKRLPDSKLQLSVPGYAYVWGLLGGLPGALLAREIFAPGLSRRCSPLGGILAILYLAPLWIPGWMTWAERASLQSALTDAEPSEAIRATQIVQTRRGTPAVLALLTPGLRSQDLHVFARAAHGLGHLGPEGRAAVESIVTALPTRHSLAERNLLLAILEKIEPAWEQRPDAARFVEPLLEHLSLRWMSNFEPDRDPLRGSRSLTAFFRYEIGSQVFYNTPIEGSPLCELVRALFRMAPDWPDSRPGQACLENLQEFSADRAPVHPFKRHAAADVLLALKAVMREPSGGDAAGSRGAPGQAGRTSS